MLYPINVSTQCHDILYTVTLTLNLNITRGLFDNSRYNRLPTGTQLFIFFSKKNR